MDSGIREIGNLVLSLALGAGPVAALIALIALLNRRDRCRARLLSLVAQQFPGKAARSDVVLDVRGLMLTGGGVVRVDVREPDGGEIRHGIERLRQTLPPEVRLVIEGASQPEHTLDLPRERRLLRSRA